MSLKYLEDWLLCLNGNVGIDGKTPHVWAITGPIKLATYDSKFIESVTMSIARGVGLTDKQVALAVKIVTKYQRQWQQLGVDPSYLLTDDIPLRLAARNIDRTTSAKILDNQIRLKFPYNQKLINDLHRLGDNSCGDWRYFKESREWVLDLTEGNIYLLSQILFPVDRFNDIPWDMDPLLEQLAAEARHCATSREHFPKMCRRDGKLVFENVSPYAVDSMISHGWKEDADNVLHWALIAKQHAISLDQSVLDAYSEHSYLGTFMAQVVASPDAMSSPGAFTGKNSMPWPVLRAVMTQLPDLNFCFYYRRNNMGEVIDLVKGMPNEVVFVLDDRKKQSINLDENLDLKNTIVVTDVMIGRNQVIDDLAHKCLGMLYMIPDDEKINV